MSRSPSLPGGLLGWRRLLIAVCALAAISIAVAGCGGGGGAAAPATASGFVPASSALYIEGTAEADGAAWTQARAIAARFPGYPRLLERIDESLAEHGVVFDRDIRPLLGERFGLALLSFADDADMLGALELAEGKEGDAVALIERAASQAGTPTPSERDGVDYWRIDDMVFAVHEGVVLAAELESTIQAAVEAHEAGGDRVIANLPRYTDVLAKLPADALATAFVNIGAAIAGAGEGDSDALLGARILGVSAESALGLAAMPLPDGVAIKAVGEGIALLRQTPAFTPTLLGRVPNDALGYIAFNDLTGMFESLLAALEADPELGPQIEGLRGQFSGFEDELGVSLEDLRALGAGEGVLAVTAGGTNTTFPNLVAVVKQADGARAKQTLDTLRPTIRQILAFAQLGFSAAGGGAGTPIPEWREVQLANGVTGWELPIDPSAGIVYAVDGNLLYVGTKPAAVRDAMAPAAAIGADAAHRRIAQKVPQRASLYAYANVQQILSFLDRQGAFRDDAELLQNLRPVQGAILAFGGGESTVLDGFISIPE